MKIILSTAGIILGVFVQAQGRRADQNIVQAAYGYIPDSKLTSENSFMLKAGYSKVIGKKGFLGKAEIFHQKYGVEYIDSQILPYQKTGISAQAGWSLENLAPFFLNVYLGGFAGYEIVNNGNERDLIYQAPITDKVKGITYGITGSLEAEIIINKNFSLTVDYSQFYDTKSSFSESNYGIFGGLKIYLN